MMRLFSFFLPMLRLLRTPRPPDLLLLRDLPLDRLRPRPFACFAGLGGGVVFFCPSSQSGTSGLPATDLGDPPCLSPVPLR